MCLKSSLFALLLIAILAGCKDNSTELINTTDEILPLKIGNSWTYKETVTSTQDNTKTTTEETYIVVISGESTFNGEQWYQAKNFLGKNDNVLLMNKTDGLWLAADNEAGLFFKFPAQINDSFTNAGGIYKLVSTSAKVQIENKEYVCYQYQTITPSTTEINYYVKPGIGLIKITRDRVLNGEDIRFVQELQSYSLK